MTNKFENLIDLVGNTVQGKELTTQLETTN